MFREENLTKKTEKIIISILWAAAVLVCIKSIFTDFGFDNSYMIAMSYRHISGDSMLLEMWEPNQTSIFLIDFFMLIYRLFIPDFTGVAIYLQIIGTLLWIPTAICAVRILGKFTDKTISNLILIFLTVYKVKSSPFLDYAGQTILFSVWVFVFLAKYYYGKKPLSAFVAGFFTFLQVIVYPSAAFVLVPTLFFLFKVKSDSKCKAILAYILGGGIPSVLYVGYFYVRVGFTGLFDIAGYIIDSDSHSVTPRFGPYYSGIINAAILFAGCAAMATIAALLFKKKKKISIPSLTVVLMIAGDLILLFTHRHTGLDFRLFVYLMPVILILAGAISYNKMTSEERIIWLLGVGISCTSFLAAFLLSDLGIITLVSFFQLGGAVSFIPLKYLCEDFRRVGILLVVLLLLHRGLVVWGYGTWAKNVMYTWELENYIRSGPAAGIVCSHFHKQKFSVDLEELRNTLSKYDRVLIIGPEIMDSLVFLYTDASISNFSVIDTPIYGNVLEDYYRLNPDKYPTVVLADCWFGNLNIPPDSYIMKWVEENFSVSENLSYYRVYR